MYGELQLLPGSNVLCPLAHPLLPQPPTPDPTAAAKCCGAFVPGLPSCSNMGSTLSWPWEICF
jgi:hypothetical protein